MGVYLRDTASTWVPGPINVADEIYNQDLPDLSTDPGVIAGGGTSVDEVDQRVSAGVGANATNTAGMNSTQNGDRLVKTRPDGRIYVLTDSITETPHAANKGYVDQAIRDQPRVIPWSGQGDMPHIPAGSMVLDYSTGVLWGP